MNTDQNAAVLWMSVGGREKDDLPWFHVVSKPHDAFGLLKFQRVTGWWPCEPVPPGRVLGFWISCGSADTLRGQVIYFGRLPCLSVCLESQTKVRGAAAHRPWGRKYFSSLYSLIIRGFVWFFPSEHCPRPGSWPFMCDYCSSMWFHV